MQTEIPKQEPHSPTNWHKRQASADAIVKLEGAFAHRLSGGVLSQPQIDVLAELFRPWTDAQIAAVVKQAVQECASYPSVSELLGFKRQFDNAEARPTGQPTSFEKLAAKNGPPWWFTLTAKLQAKKFKMTDIGDELVAEAKRRNEALPSGLYLGGGRVS